MVDGGNAWGRVNGSDGGHTSKGGDMGEARGGGVIGRERERSDDVSDDLNNIVCWV